MPWRRAALCCCAVVLLAGCSPAGRPSDLDLTSLEQWDVVVIGDSTLWGIGEGIAEKVEADYGISPVLHDFSIPNLTARQALDAALSNNPDTPNARMLGWPDLIQGAEYVVLHPSPAESVSASYPADWSCMYPPYYVADCSPATFQQFQSDLRSLVDEILRLRAGKSTIIRFGSYWGRPANWEQDQALDACRACLETYSDAIEQVASEYGVPYVSFLDILNGPNHLLDPQEQGYIGADNVHMSEEGIQLLTDEIWRLGITPAHP
jgi:hypothetical protein